MATLEHLIIGDADSRGAEIARRAAAILHGHVHDREPATAHSVNDRIESAGRRAQSIVAAGGGCAESRRNAALEFLAAAAISAALDSDFTTGDAYDVVTEAAAAIGISRTAARLSVFLRAPSTPEALLLPPWRVRDLVVRLLVELGPADAASLWAVNDAGQIERVASAGAAVESRRMRAAARNVLEADTGTLATWTGHVRGVQVLRWDATHWALVTRVRPDRFAECGVYLDEAALMLSHLAEQEMLFARNADREQALVSASERHLTRLGCDLHDGPLQEIVAFADELRRARAQITAMVEVDVTDRVRGRFDDLEARLTSLDRGLRELSHSVRSASAIDQSLEDAVRAEVLVLARSGSDARFTSTGDFAALTASQRIVLFRVVQEALSNVRRHSSADRVGVRLHATARYVAVTVTDDGQGFDVEAAKRSGRLGLTGVVERVRLLGGDIEIESSPGRGTRLRVVLPRWSPASEPTSPLYAVTT